MINHEIWTPEEGSFTFNEAGLEILPRIDQASRQAISRYGLTFSPEGSQLFTTLSHSFPSLLISDQSGLTLTRFRNNFLLEEISTLIQLTPQFSREGLVRSILNFPLRVNIQLLGANDTNVKAERLALSGHISARSNHSIRILVEVLQLQNCGEDIPQNLREIVDYWVTTTAVGAE